MQGILIPLHIIANRTPFSKQYSWPVSTHIPFEIRGDGQIDLEHRARDWLHMGIQLQARELMDVAVQGLPHLGHVDQCAQLLRVQVIEALPGQVLLFNLQAGKH